MRTAFPGLRLERTKITSSPWKSFICGISKGSSDEASPLQAAWYFAPFTENSNSLSAFGHSFPSASSILTVTNDMSAPSAFMVFRSGESSIFAGLPAVRTTFSAARFPVSSYATTFSSPGSYLTFIHFMRLASKSFVGSFFSRPMLFPLTNNSASG